MRADERDSLRTLLGNVEVARGEIRHAKAGDLLDGLGFKRDEDFLGKRFDNDTLYALATVRYAVANRLYELADVEGSSILCLSSVPYFYDCGDTLRAFDGLILQSSNYIRLGSYADALPSILKAHSIASSIPDSAMMASALSNLGTLYLSIRKPAAAITYLEEAVAITRRLKSENNADLARRLSNLAESYTVAGRADEALRAITESLEYEIREKRDSRIPSRFCIMGDAYVESGDLTRAENCYMEAFVRNQLTGGVIPQAIILKQLGGLRYRQKRPLEANKYLLQALEMVHEYGLIYLKEQILDLLYRVNRPVNPALALEYFEQHSQLKDSLRHAETQRQMNVLHARYETEQKEHQILAQQVELEHSAKRRRYLTLGVIFTSLGLLFVAYHLYTNMKQKRLLAELNETKNRFFSIISHDTKSIASSIKLVLDQTLKYYAEMDDTFVYETLTELKTAADTQLELLDNLLHWAHMQQKTEQFNPEEFDLVAMAERNLRVARLPIQNKEIRIQTSFPLEAAVYADRQMVDTIVRNLLSNAIKFSHAGGQIAVTIEEETSCVQLKVRDWGIGMSREQVDNLGRIDKRVVRFGTRGEQGSGLGLILCFNMARRNHGNLEVSSAQDEGTSITLTLHKPGEKTTQLLKESKNNGNGKNTNR